MSRLLHLINAKCLGGYVFVIVVSLSIRIIIQMRGDCSNEQVMA
jgi:hypothetical protein